MFYSKEQRNQRAEAIKAKITLIIKILDFLRKLLGLQTRLDKWKTEQMVRRIAGLYEVDVEVLVAVIWAESGMNPKKITRNLNRTTDYGLCQFNDYWYGHIISPHDALNNPELAVRTMCQQWVKGRQNDWIAHRNKSYLKYLNVK